MKFQIVIEVEELDELINAVEALKGAGAVATVTEQLPVKAATNYIAEQESEDEEDPWTGQSTQKAQKSPQKPSGKSSSPSSDDDEDGVWTTTDRFDNKWTCNLPDAPLCFCNEPAGKVKAKSRAGKWYSAWRCAKQVGPGDAWKSKCDFSERI